MNKELSKEIKEMISNNDIKFEVAKLEQLEEIYQLYNSRTIWFKENNIRQWSRYILRHEKEFPVLINNEKYYILKRNNEIIAGFEISENPGYFEDNGESLYLSKVVTKVGYKNLGKILFSICKDIAKANGKKYLRLDCIRWNEKLNAIYEKHGFKLVGYGKSDYEYCLRECNVYE